MQSCFSPRYALSVPGGFGSQISRQSAHQVGKFVSCTPRPPLPITIYSQYLFLLEAESTAVATVRQEGQCQTKIQMTPSGIEPYTFLLEAQCINEMRQAVNHHLIKVYILIDTAVMPSI